MLENMSKELLRYILTHVYMKMFCQPTSVQSSIYDTDFTVNISLSLNILQCRLVHLTFQADILLGSFANIGMLGTFFYIPVVWCVMVEVQHCIEVGCEQCC